MIIRPACMEALLDMGKALGKVDHLIDEYGKRQTKEDWDLAGYWAGTLRARFNEIRESCPPSKTPEATDSPEDSLDNNLHFLQTAFRVNDTVSAIRVFQRLEGYLVEWLDDMVFGQPERMTGATPSAAFIGGGAPGTIPSEPMGAPVWQEGLYQISTRAGPVERGIARGSIRRWAGG